MRNKNDDGHEAAADESTEKVVPVGVPAADAGETGIIVLGPTFPVEAVTVHGLGTPPSAGGPVLCATPDCDPLNPPCRTDASGRARDCGSLAGDLRQIGGAREVETVRVTVVTGTGAVSFQIDCGAPARSGSADAAPAHGTAVDAPPIRVWIESDDPALNDRLLREFSRTSDLEPADGCLAGDARLDERLQHPDIDVLLLDKQSFDRMDRDLQRTVQCFAGRRPVLLLLDAVDPDTVKAVLGHRFRGYLMKTCPAETYCRAIRAVHEGDVWLPRALLVKSLERWMHWDEGAEIDAVHDATHDPGANLTESQPFTAREREVLALLKQGMSNKQIARELGVMEDTVKKHLQHVYDKVGIRRRTLLLAGGAAV